MVKSIWNLLHKMLRVMLFIAFLSTYNLLSAQVVVKSKPVDESKPSLRERIFTGGNFALSFGSSTYVDISPLIGYRVTERFSVGVGATYMYSKTRFFQEGINVYGGRVFGRYFILESLFLHSEYEALSMGIANSDLNIPRIPLYSVLVGGGYSQQLGRASSLQIMLLYNMGDPEQSPYTNPVLRVGFNVGI